MAEENPARGRGGFRKDLALIPQQHAARDQALLRVADPKGRNLKPVRLLANYVAIRTRENSLIHQCYRIDYEPPVENVQHMAELFRTASRQAFRSRPLFDGAHECRSRQQLAEPVTTVEVVSEFGGENQTFRVIFTHTGVITTGSELLRSLNIELKSFFRCLGYFQPQPGLHVHPRQAIPIGQDVRILAGFRTAATFNKENRMLMNFEGSHKLMQTRNVREILHALSQQQGIGNFQEAARVQLTGKLVITSYNDRAYRIEDVDFSMTPQSTFTLRDGTETTFVNFFRTRHNIEIRDMNQPLLNVVPSNRRRRGDDEPEGRELRLVPETCNIAGLTDAQRNDNRLKMDLIRASQIPPQQRVEQLRKFLRDFHDNAEVRNRLNEHGYDYSEDLLRIMGHEFPPTALALNPRHANAEVANWPRADLQTGDFQAQSLAVAPNITKMAIVVGRGDFGAKQAIMDRLRSGFQRVDLRVNPGDVAVFDLDGDSPGHFTRSIRSLPRGLTLAIIVVQRQNKPLYDAIKKAATCELGLPTQVVTSRLLTDQRRAGSAATKIAIQIAAKVGGEPWWVDLQGLKAAMVCGYDTYHDTASRGRSYGAFIASMNDRYSRWYSVADAHERLQEMSTHIATNMLNALNQYKSINQKLPERVFIYRDGVSEGQIEHVFNTEVKAISERIKSIDEKIKLTVILVNKRIGARFYMTQDGASFVNPRPGTVVDHEVTKPGRYDFYLISQSTRQGTVTPTYYSVIHDENNYTPELHQKMAYKFCFLYYNWSGSVRVPAPCQYAHKLAYLCGEHLHLQPNANLNDRLHYL